MVLLQDPVASVRRDSFKGVAALINTMQTYIDKNRQLGGKLLALCSEPPPHFNLALLLYFSR